MGHKKDDLYHKNCSYVMYICWLIFKKYDKQVFKYMLNCSC